MSELKNLKLHLCGHIHEGRGEYETGKIKMINAACEMRLAVPTNAKKEEE